VGKQLNHIELFAGCGGLSLGLELAGFELLLANELSPMAGETFAFNFLKENLEALAEKGESQSNVFWLSSKYPDLERRLRENPFEYPELGKGESDIPNNPNELKGKLIVGNIIHLNQLLNRNPKLKEALGKGFNNKEVDLVSGGPPCQSFSLAGLRRKDCDKNILPWEFANFVDHIQPKFVVLENVTGILRAFNEGGVSYHAWFEIAKAFAKKGYIPLCLHINARLAGVPQNRPRFVMLGIRKDIHKKASKKFNHAETELFKPCEVLFNEIQEGKTVNFAGYPCYDVKKNKDIDLFENSFLSPLVNSREVSVRQAIGDIRLNSRSSKSKYVRDLTSSFRGILGKPTALENHVPRTHNPLVKRRFRIYQVVQKCGKEVGKEVFAILKEKENSLSEQSWQKLKDFEYFAEGADYAESNEDGFISFGEKAEFIKYLAGHPTKKQTQKSLDPDLPAPAALSIPDDACHYDHQELRTLTVREMARIQSFPDNFEFRSKVTTGGKMRRFEVPQYTQVGNAVPPLLGVAIGTTIKNLLNKL